MSCTCAAGSSSGRRGLCGMPPHGSQCQWSLLQQLWACHAITGGEKSWHRSCLVGTQRETHCGEDGQPMKTNRSYEDKLLYSYNGMQLCTGKVDLYVCLGFTVSCWTEVTVCKGHCQQRSLSVFHLASVSSTGVLLHKVVTSTEDHSKHNYRVWTVRLVTVKVTVHNNLYNIIYSWFSLCHEQSRTNCHVYIVVRALKRQVGINVCAYMWHT